ncbi:flavodoxin [Levilactobacillus humaensis]|uniref:flavodoxin n=1 Tax=Levilactobacillus humaensis TaxID=2950375 RepID=UPI0021C386D7|nr:flavodoxin [Levilactobacillus humaensis]
MGQSVVLYLSNTGHTQAVAEKIAATTGAKLMAIKPQQTYTAADLDWNDHDSRSYHEMHGGRVRPAIAPVDSATVSQAATVYLGFPLWWATAPRPIDTLLDSVDLSGKKVLPFCTSGSSAIDEAIRQLRVDYPAVNWQDGQRFTSTVTAEEIQEWSSKA